MLKRLPSLAAATFLVATAAATSADAQRLSLSTWGSPKHYQVAEFVPRFEALLKEKSGGKIRLKTFAGGEMVKQQFVSTAVPQGTIDISLTTLDNWSGRIPDVTILTTPLWTHSMAWTLENLKPGNAIFDYYDNKMRAEGAIILNMFDIGPPVISANFLVKEPKDFSGKAIRVYSKGSGLIMQALGASPTIMGVGDVYSGLQRGTVDGALGGLGGAVGLKHYEVTKHMWVPNGVLGTLIHAYVMNKEKFESLSPELQKAVMESAQEARDIMQKLAIDKLSKLLDVVREHGNTVDVVEPGGDQWKVFQSALEPYTAGARSEYPAELVTIITGS